MCQWKVSKLKSKEGFSKCFPFHKLARICNSMRRTCTCCCSLDPRCERWSPPHAASPSHVRPSPLWISRTWTPTLTCKTDRKEKLFHSRFISRNCRYLSHFCESYQVRIITVNCVFSPDSLWLRRTMKKEMRLRSRITEVTLIVNLLIHW